MLTICERCILGSAVKVASTCKSVLEEGKDPQLLGYAGRKKKREAEVRLMMERKRREDEGKKRLAESESQQAKGEGEGMMSVNGLEGYVTPAKEDGEGGSGGGEGVRNQEEIEEGSQRVSTDQGSPEQQTPATPSVETVTQNGGEEFVERVEESEAQTKENGEEEEEEEEEGEEEEGGQGVADRVREEGKEGEGRGEIVDTSDRDGDVASEALSQLDIVAKRESEEKTASGEG